MAKFLLSGKFRLICGEQMTPWFDNLITDAGLDRVGVGEYLTWCSVGSGETAAEASDVEMGSLVASTSNLTQVTPVAGRLQLTFVFSPGSSENIPELGTVTEVGVGWNDSEIGLFSRSVLPDPLPVPLGQALTVLYELTLVPPADDEVYSLLIQGGTSITCMARAAYVGNNAEWAWGLSGAPIAFALGPDNAPLIYDGELGAASSFPGGTAVAHGSQVAYPYLPGSHYLELEGRWNIDNGNLGDGVSATLFYTNGYGAYQIGFDPPLTKTCYDTLKLTYRVSWGRYAS